MSADAVAVTAAWSVSGSYFEACNCDVICPCRSIGGRPGGRSTHGVCQFALSWHVDDGHAGDVDLGGLDVVMAGFYVDDEPGSPWQVVLYVDDRARPDQARWLADIFLGRAGGGTRRNFAAAIATVHAVRTARIDLDHRPGSWAIGVERYVSVRAGAPVPGDETVACGIPGLDRPGQELYGTTLLVADAPLDWELVGHCAFATDFAYTSAG